MGRVVMGIRRRCAFKAVWLLSFGISELERWCEEIVDMASGTMLKHGAEGVFDILWSCFEKFKGDLRVNFGRGVNPT